MSLKVTWSDDVRRYHEFDADDVARASEHASPPDVSWPEHKDRPRAPFDAADAIARWDAFVKDHGVFPVNDWRARDAAVDALKAIAEGLWGRDGKLGAAEANFWFHVFTSTDIFDDHANPEHDSFDRASWLAGAPKLYDTDTARDRLVAFTTTRARTSGYWSIYTFLWIGWFLDGMLPPADVIKVACAGFAADESSKLLAKIEPFPADHQVSAERVAMLDACFTLDPSRSWGSHDQKSVGEMLAHIPSTKVARDLIQVSLGARIYNNGVPFWSYFQLVDDDKLSLKQLVRTSATVMDWHEENENLTPSRLVAYFLHFGYDGLASVSKLMKTKDQKRDLEKTLPHFAKIHAPEMAAALFEIEGKVEAKGMHREILLREGANAVLGLITLSKSRGKKRDFALELLAEYAKNGHVELIERLLPQAPKAAQKVVRGELLDTLADDLANAPEELSAEDLPDALKPILDLTADITLPDKIDASLFPPLFLRESGARLPEAFGERLVAALELKYGRYHSGLRTRDDWVFQSADTPEKRAAIEALGSVRAMLDPVSADALWHNVCDQDVADSRWSMSSMTLMSVVELGSESAYQRLEMGMRNRSSGFMDGTARIAMDALVETGEQAAWAALQEASVRTQSRTLRESAEAKLDQLREERGWTLGELHDRLVPSCRLDARGTRVFDYGGRQFELVFQGAFDVALTDSDGKRYDRLPPARKSDDRALVKAAKADFKITKEQIRLVVEGQTRRLEDDLVTARAWVASQWKADVLGHPLLRHFARTLIWGHYEDDALVSTFVPDLDGACMDADFEEVELPDDASVRIAHPLELDTHQVASWEAVLADFELQQPFDQLHRDTYPADTLDASIGWANQNVRNWRIWEGLKKTRRWKGLIKIRKSTPRKYAERMLGESGFKARLCFHKGAWSLSGGATQPPDGLYFFEADAVVAPSAILDPAEALPERVVSEVIRELKDALASETR